MGLYYKVAGTAEGTAVTAAIGGSYYKRLYVSEWSGVSVLDSVTSLSVQGPSASQSIGPVAPTAGGAGLAVAALMSALPGYSAESFSAGAGYTSRDEGKTYDSPGYGPRALQETLATGTVSGSYTATASTSMSATWAGALAFFTGSAAPSGTATPGGELGGNTNFDGIGTVIGPYIQAWRISRGASPELTGGAQPGQMSLTLKNTSNQFNPENSGSPIINLLTDGVPIWVGVNSDGQLSGTAVRGLFGGRVVDITPLPVPGAPHPPTVEITAEDELARLGRVRTSIATSRERSHSDLRSEVLANAQVLNTDLPPEISTMPLSGADGYALGVLEELNRATGTRHFIQPADSAEDWYTYVARDRHWHLAGTAQGTVAGTAHVTSVDGWRRSADTVINQQRVTFEPIAFTPATVTVWESDALPFAFTGSRDIWVQFDDYVDSPTVDIAYTGSTVTSSVTPFGETAKLTISSAGTSTVTALSLEGPLARRAPSESYVANNTTSQGGSRGIRSGSDVSGDYVGVLASARGLAEHVVWRFGSPQVRPTLTVQNWFPYQFDLDLFDLISFSSTELGVTSRLFEIVGLVHEGNHAGSVAIHHTTTYTLQECRVQTATNWFQTDVHAPDGSAITGY